MHAEFEPDIQFASRQPLDSKKAPQEQELSFSDQSEDDADEGDNINILTEDPAQPYERNPYVKSLNNSLNSLFESLPSLGPAPAGRNTTKTQLSSSNASRPAVGHAQTSTTQNNATADQSTFSGSDQFTASMAPGPHATPSGDSSTNAFTDSIQTHLDEQAQSQQTINQASYNREMMDSDMTDEPGHSAATQSPILQSTFQNVSNQSIETSVGQAQPEYSNPQYLGPYAQHTAPQGSSGPQAGGHTSPSTNSPRVSGLSVEDLQSALQKLGIGVIKQLSEYNMQTSQALAMKIEEETSRNRQDLAKVDTYIRSLGITVSKVGVVIENALNPLTKINATIKNVDSRVSDMTSMLNKVHETIGTQVASVKSGVADLDSAIGGRLASLATTVDGIGLKVEKNTIGLTRHVHDLGTTVEGKVANLKVDSLKEDVTDLKNTIRALGDDVDKKITALQTSVESLVTAQNKITDNLARICEQALKVGEFLHGHNSSSAMSTTDAITQTGSDLQKQSFSAMPSQSRSLDSKSARISVNIYTLTDENVRNTIKTFDSAFPLKLSEMQSFSDLIQSVDSKLGAETTELVSKIDPSHRLRLREIVASSEERGIDKCVSGGDWEVWLMSFAPTAPQQILDVRLEFQTVSKDKQVFDSKKRKLENGSAVEDKSLFFCRNF